MDEDTTTHIIIDANRDDGTGFSSRLHCLEMLEGPDVGRRYLIGSTGLTLGRIAPADIVLPDPEVSRAHCRVSLNGDEVIVTDLNSTNGSFVDGEKVDETAILPVGGVLRLGREGFKHEWLTARQFRRSDELDRDLTAAFAYVEAQLPSPLIEGPIRTNWRYLPSSKLGGDAFGYDALSETLFSFYLIDVSGHGAGAAMHSISVMNVLRQRALPGVDMRQPGQVLTALNVMFPMERHAELYFTMWYGVFDSASRRLDFASAGHHPSYLVPADRSEAIPLQTKNPLIGAFPVKSYRSESVTIPSQGSVYLFSDGVFEIVTDMGVQWNLADFVPLICQPPLAGFEESARLLKHVRALTPNGEFDDDFSLMVVTFN